MLDKNNLKFPPNFLLGAAVSSYQTEGNNINTDWWEWEQKYSGIAGGPEEKSGNACNSYVDYKKDIDLAKSLNFNCYRLSVEWARIEPEEGKFDQEVLDHYRQQLQELKTNGFTVFLTLNHFTIPIWFKNKGGWESADCTKLFVRFASVCSQNFYNFVDYWATFNEPLVLISEGYTNGHWPPNKSNIVSALIVFITILKTHKATYKTLKEFNANIKVGIVHHATQFSTNSTNFLDNLASKLLNYFSQELLFKLLNSYNDYLGINYYTEYKVHNLKVFHERNVESNDLRSWPISPKGLYLIIKNLTKYNKPMYVTENGIATSDENLRRKFIVGHLLAIRRAQQEGAEVNGYMYWSLLDNFEWLQGYSKKFGLVAVDQTNNYERIVKESAKCYAEICRLHEVPKGLYEDIDDF